MINFTITCKYRSNTYKINSFSFILSIKQIQVSLCDVNGTMTMNGTCHSSCCTIKITHCSMAMSNEYRSTFAAVTFPCVKNSQNRRKTSEKQTKKSFRSISYCFDNFGFSSLIRRISDCHICCQQYHYMF